MNQKPPYETREDSWIELKSRIEHLEEANEQLYAVCKRYATLLEQSRLSHGEPPTTAFTKPK